MAHVLILGQTESGKTTLGKALGANYRAAGVKTLVLDMMNDPGWQADFQTRDQTAFLNAVWNSEKCAVFVDEAGSEVGRYNTVMQELATKGRHWGHNVHFLSQRGAQLAATVRDQCSHLYLFTSGMKDRQLHAEEWNAPGLIQTLQRGEYFHVTRFGTFEKGSVFNQESQS